MISAVLITSKLCSITSTLFPASTNLCSTSISLSTSAKWSPVVGSSRIYIVFPVLCKMFKTMTVSATLIIALLYILNLFWGLTSTSVETSFINGLFLFWVGMLLTKVSKYLKRNILVTAITFILSAAIIFYRVNVVEAVRLAMMNLLGITLFVFLYGLFGFEWNNRRFFRKQSI